MTPLRLTSQEFELLRRMVHAQTGIALGEAKRAVLEARLRKRVLELGLPSFLGYWRHLQEGGGERELQAFVDAVTTNTTSFFREPVHFHFLARELLPRWASECEARGSRRVRLWSAACSSGQEPYSMAAVVHAAGARAERLDLRILGTDVSERALATARSGEYPADALATIPGAWRGGFVAQGQGAARRLRVTGALRERVVLRALNLLAEAYPFSGRFDVIFCRNVFIYFDEPTKVALLERLTRQLVPGGHLLLGLSESLVRVPRGLEPLGQSIYRRRPEVERG